ncbi:uncharacterized protein EV420DRAFT_1634690 [Desarmillaria tabescens]|uniref:Extracellular mutant protein 11 C-terminal domain-containing protein n=1 Tax=Armillaria tabescens TaxID=1929756 RepID=A0AA39NR22_ARMTA|nr:uncharacterized protein EV420DRAFT_1634690 [Desarmillaria tabescens]KAK0470253.1 hypothetical protein EV420DRAFT_1634690 [Desarmillaria tabescens]
MSARQPFVPMGPRPVSRTAHHNAPAPPQKSSFAPDKTNPLHSNADGNGNSSNTPPLNLQNLMKKKSLIPGKNSIPAPGRRTSGSEHALEKEKGPLPGFPRRVQTSNPNIVAPHPLPPPLSMSPLYAGAELSLKPTDPSQSHTLQSPTEKDAHIPASFAVPDVSFASPAKLNTKFQHMPQPQSGGPQRTNENRNKRSRSEFGEDEATYAYDADYGSGQNKRYKMDGPDKYPDPFSPAPLSSPLRHPEYRNSPTSSNRGYRQHADNESFHDYHPNNLSQGNEGALDKLLGRDANIFVEEHMDSYEALIEKWKNCTTDEWIAGADVIMVKYSKILEFVKTHMTTKLKLFAAFDKQVDSHGVVLEERQKVLAGVKQKLVSESGNILGRDKS